jgi:hypothetical protein
VGAVNNGSIMSIGGSSSSSWPSSWSREDVWFLSRLVQASAAAAAACIPAGIPAACHQSDGSCRFTSWLLQSSIHMCPWLTKQRLCGGSLTCSVIIKLPGQCLPVTLKSMLLSLDGFAP